MAVQIKTLFWRNEFAMSRRVQTTNGSLVRRPSLGLNGGLPLWRSDWAIVGRLNVMVFVLMKRPGSRRTYKIATPYEQDSVVIWRVKKDKTIWTPATLDAQTVQCTPAKRHTVEMRKEFVYNRSILLFLEFQRNFHKLHLSAEERRRNGAPEEPWH